MLPEQKAVLLFLPGPERLSGIRIVFMKASEGARRRAPLACKNIPFPAPDTIVRRYKTIKYFPAFSSPKKYGPSVIRRPVFSDHGGMAIGNKKNDQMLFPFSRISAE